MGRHRNAFSVYRSYDCYYVRFYDGNDIRRQRALGTKNKTTAHRIAAEWYRDGKLAWGNGQLRFASYARDWWIPGKCKYILGEELRGGSLSPDYCRNCRSWLERYILPRFGRTRLCNISVAQAERWLFDLVFEYDLANKTANNIFSVLSTMLGEAKRTGYLSRNPCEDVRPLKNNSKVKGRLTLAETRSLFASLEPWRDDRVQMLANMLAACTAMRQGEVLATRVRDIHDDRIHVEHSWRDNGKDGPRLKCTKTRNIRDIPLPEGFIAELRRLCFGRGQDAFVFSYTGGETPISKDSVVKSLKQALEHIRVDYRGRNISFHSWRYFLNTSLVSLGLPQELVQSITGHRTLDMTRHYTVFDQDDYRKILRFTSNIAY